MMAVSPEADRAGTLIPIVNFRSQKFQLLGNQDFNKQAVLSQYLINAVALS